MRIAICDDSRESREEILKNICENPFIGEQLEHMQFSNGEELIDAYESGERFDLVFMDVEMGETNGIQSGIKIREYDSKAIIVFVSNYPKYAISAYDCEAFYFIVKPIDAVGFQKVLNKAIEKYKLVHQYYVIKSKSTIRRIEVQNILFVETVRKHLIFHLASEHIEIPGKISEVTEQLKQYGFYQVHQGYCVNMNHIKEFCLYDIIMDNDERVMVSIRKRAEVMKAYAEYLEKVY